MHIIPYVNVGNEHPSSLVHHLNLFSIADLPKSLDAPRMSPMGMKLADYHRIKEDGFHGVQSHLLLNPSPEKARQSNLALTAAGIIKPKKLLSAAKKWKAHGYLCATVMIGSGNETLQEALEIARLTLEVSQQVKLPIYLELHRGTVTQDIDIVLAIIKAHPGLKFNADFSHYITAYRWCETFTENTLQLLKPILDRVAYLHLRPSNSEHIQLTSLQGNEENLYGLLLEETFKAFKANACNGDIIIAAPELLPRITGYAVTVRNPEGHTESGDRYAFSRYLKDFAEGIFHRGFSYDFPASLPTIEKKNGDIIVNLRSVRDVQLFDPRDYPEENVVRVRLGRGSCNEIEDKVQLVSEMKILVSKDFRCVLDIARDTLTHDVNRALLLQKDFGELPFYLNASEWVIGQEHSVEQLGKLASKIKLLNGVKQTGKSQATAEHHYHSDIHYSTRANLSPSVVIEKRYKRFYRAIEKWFESIHKIDLISKR